MAAASMRIEPRKSSRFSSAASFSLLDVLLDIAGHLVEGFGKLADFGGAGHGHAFMKFGAADGADGFDEAANRAGDAKRENVSERQRHERDADNEAQGFGGQFGDAGVDARVVETALRDHGPAKLRNRAVGADHFDRVAAVLRRAQEIRGLSGTQFARAAR